MSWVVLIDNTAKKQLARISENDAAKIIIAIKEFSINPYTGDIEKLKGEKDTWRRRVGSHRILYEIYQQRRLIYVFDVRRRTSTTY